MIDLSDFSDLLDLVSLGDDWVVDGDGDGGDDDDKVITEFTGLLWYDETEYLGMGFKVDVLDEDETKVDMEGLDSDEEIKDEDEDEEEEINEDEDESVLLASLLKWRQKEMKQK